MRNQPPDLQYEMVFPAAGPGNAALVLRVTYVSILTHLPRINATVLLQAYDGNLTSHQT